MKATKKRANEKECQEKRATALRLYVAGSTLPQIAQNLNIHYEVLRRWAKKYDFKGEKARAPLALADILSRLQRDLQQKIDKGTLTADQAIKYAAAIERLSNRNRLNFYLMDAFSRIQQAMEARIQRAKPSEKPAWLEALKRTAEVVEQERNKTPDHEGF